VGAVDLTVVTDRSTDRTLKVFGWTSDPGGCGLYRIAMPMYGLAEYGGHDAIAFDDLNVDLPPDLDVLVGQLISDPIKSEAWQALARMPGRWFAMVYEIDDDLWNIRPSNPGYGWASERREMFADNIRASDAVTVTTPRLAEVVRRYNPNVYVLPNCCDAAFLAHERPRSQRVTVGWAGGGSHAEDFASVSKDLASFFRRRQDVDCHLFGTDYRRAVGRPDGRFTGWQRNLVEYLCSLDFDIGLAPLAANEFNRSKSDVKFLEYASLGIPVVASDYGPYAEAIQHGETGLKVRYPHEWRKHLNAMVNDEAMRAEIGAAARRWAQTRTLQNNYWRWEAAYTEVLGRVRAPALS
jgi:glycosyltransferase involved in cell wall biosynthesis